MVSSVVENLTGFPFDRDIVQVRKLELPTNLKIQTYKIQTATHKKH